MIMPAFRLSMPSGLMSVPSRFIPKRNLKNMLSVRPPWKESRHDIDRSTQSRICSGNTSNSALNMNQNPEKMSR